MTELNPCPICGNPPTLIEDKYANSKWRIVCNNSNHRVIVYGSTEEEAVNRWNQGDKL
jgi:hypothetical protein